MTVQCPEKNCTRKFETRKGLLRHRASAHRLESRSRLQCAYCGAVFSQGKRLVQLHAHLRSAHPTLPIGPDCFRKIGNTEELCAETPAVKRELSCETTSAAVAPPLPISPRTAATAAVKVESAVAGAVDLNQTETRPVQSEPLDENGADKRVPVNNMAAVKMEPVEEQTNGSSDCALAIGAFIEPKTEKLDQPDDDTNIDNQPGSSADPSCSTSGVGFVASLSRADNRRRCKATDLSRLNCLVRKDKTFLGSVSPALWKPAHSSAAVDVAADEDQKSDYYRSRLSSEQSQRCPHGGTPLRWVEFVCTCCMQSFLTRKALSAHMYQNISHVYLPSSCAQCGSVAVDMTKHATQQHSLGLKSIVLDGSYENGLGAHEYSAWAYIRQQAGCYLQPYPCPVCGHALDQPDQLQLHIQQQHSDHCRVELLQEYVVRCTVTAVDMSQQTWVLPIDISAQSCCSCALSSSGLATVLDMGACALLDAASVKCIHCQHTLRKESLATHMCSCAGQMPRYPLQCFVCACSLAHPVDANRHMLRAHALKWRSKFTHPVDGSVVKWYYLEPLERNGVPGSIAVDVGN